MTNKFFIISLLTFCFLTSTILLSPKSAEAKVTCSLKQGTLTVKGKGEMPSSLKMPSKKKVKKIIVRSGVTSLPPNAFYNFPKVEKITIANSVKRIEDDAFGRCPRLKEISMPGNYKHSGNHQRWDYTDKTVKDIYFTSDVNLKIAADLPAENLHVPAKDSHYKSIDGCIYTKDGKSLICIPRYRYKVTTAPGCTDFHVESSNEYAKIVLSEEIRSISVGKNATRTYGCSFTIRSKQLSGNALFTLINYFPDSTTKEDDEYQYDVTKLPPNVRKERDCYILDDVLLYYAGKETSFTIPDGIRKIAPRAFLKNDTLKSLSLPNGITHIGNEGLYYCYMLKKINLPSSLTYLGESCFENCSLENIEIPSKIDKIPYRSFAFCYITNLVIPDNVKVIEQSAFESNQIKSLKLGKNVRRIEHYAFEDNKLKSLTLPKKLSYVGKQAFNLNRLKKLTIPKNVKTIKKSAFQSEKIVIQGSTRHFSPDAFWASQYTYKKGIKHAATVLSDWEALDNTKGNHVYAKIEWGKVNGASGYEIKVSSYKKMKKKVTKKTITKNSTKTTVKVYNKKLDYDMYCMIRPFTTKKGKKVYGRWTKDIMEINRCL